MKIIDRKLIALTLAVGALPFAMVGSGNADAISFSRTYKMPASTGFEPGIDITRGANGDQIVYVHEPTGTPGHSSLYRLEPGDAKFQQVPFAAPWNRLPGGGDSDIAIRGDDIWFIDLWLGSNSIVYSSDRGRTWTAGTPVTSIPTADRQWIGLGDTTVDALGQRQTTVYLTDQGALTPRQTFFARSRNNGIVWDHYGPVSEAASLGMADIPAHLVSSGKTIAIAAVDRGEMQVAVSHDEGATWRVTDATGGRKDANGSLNGLTMNPENPDQMAIIYPAKSGGGVIHLNQIVARTTNDGGATWSDPIMLSPTGLMGWFPWIDWRGDKIAAAWYQATTTKPGSYGFDPNTPPAGNAWEVWYAESLDGGSTWSNAVDVGAGQVKKGAICTNGLSCGNTGTLDRELGDFLQIAIDFDGRSWISFGNHALNPALQGNGLYVKVQD